MAWVKRPGATRVRLGDMGTAQVRHGLGVVEHRRGVAGDGDAWELLVHAVRLRRARRGRDASVEAEKQGREEREMG